MQHPVIEGVDIQAPETSTTKEILTDDAVRFLTALHRKYEGIRQELLHHRKQKQETINDGLPLEFLKETAEIRNDPSWRVAKTPEPLQKRWVEITGPTDRKMMINALNSGADCFMADLEDANSPTWENMLEGQRNLRDAVRGTISYQTEQGKNYTLNDRIATLLVRPRGWHLDEGHFLVDGEPISGSLFDFGLFIFHNGAELAKSGRGPFFYLPKMESHREAELWNAVFVSAQEALGITHGTIRATVLIETLPAAFQMEEILYALRDHSGGLNAGRWDYIFSAIKTFRRKKGLQFPDRGQIVMTVPFLRAYTELLVRTCHKRGAHAIGGMAAFIPAKDAPEVTEKALAKVREDKLREVGDGFDGTWVAHPALVPIAREVFEKALGDKLHQKERLREEVRVTAEQLTDFRIEGGTITEGGLRLNLNVALQYLASWLQGRGAAAINNLMEDAATAEISRAQVWQWLNSGAKTDGGRLIDREYIQEILQEEWDAIRKLYGKHFNEPVFEKARKEIERLIFAEKFIDFLTQDSYERGLL